MLVPNDHDRSVVHEIIYEELCLGVIKQEFKGGYLRIVDDLYNKGAQAIILGCTEIALLIQQQDTQVPLYDTTEIHAAKAVEFALAGTA